MRRAGERREAIAREPRGIGGELRRAIRDFRIVGLERAGVRQVIHVVVTRGSRLKDELSKFARVGDATNVGDALVGRRRDDDEVYVLRGFVATPPRDLREDCVSGFVDVHNGAMIAE